MIWDNMTPVKLDTKSSQSILLTLTFKKLDTITQKHKFTPQYIPETTQPKEVVNKTKILHTANTRNSGRGQHHQHNNGIRLEIRLNITKVSEEETVTEQRTWHLQEMVDKFKIKDSSLIILPWLNKNGDVPLEEYVVPGEKHLFSRYFQRF
jgi:hypothetical protein